MAVMAKEVGNKSCNNFAMSARLYAQNAGTLYRVPLKLARQQYLTVHMKTYNLRVSVPVTADCLSERRIYRTKVVEISETRILFSVLFSHKLNKSERPLKNFYCQITMLKCQIRGTVTSFTCKITHEGRSMR
jgi:hypothetical protein